MIELELKYELKKKIDLDRFGSFKEVEDIYYDTHDYQLLRNGNFLRIRNNKQLDFKLNANDLSHLYCKETNFSLNDESILGINEVLKSVGVMTTLNSIEDLSKNLEVLAPIKKKRYSYKLEDKVVIVIDEVENLGTFLEIEYDIDKDSITQEEAKYYKDYLMNILNKNKLGDCLEREVHIGYVELYLKKYNKEAYSLGIYKE